MAEEDEVVLSLEVAAVDEVGLRGLVGLKTHISDPCCWPHESGTWVYW